MTDAERLDAIRVALGIDDGSEAGLNLLGVLYDMEENGWLADKVCQSTLNRVLGQLRRVSDILRNSESSG